METIRSRRILSLVAALAIFMGLGLAASASAQNCGTLLSQDEEHYPQYSGALQDLLSTGNNDAYIYAATQWGYVRASLSNPSSPGPLKLIQVGGKSLGLVSNGGLIPMSCDCGQGMSTFAVADAVGGTSKIVSNWIAPSWSTIDPGVAVQTSGGGDPVFGDILNVRDVGGSSQVAAMYFPGTGKYFGYMPDTGLGSGNGPIQIVDLTSLDGSPNLANARNPIGSFGWGGVFTLRAGNVSVGGIQKAILVGYVTSDATVRVAEINGTTGMPAQTASIVAPFGVAFSIANVNGRAYVFIAAGGAGLNVYEYTGTALNFAGNIPGSYDDVVVKGSPGSQYPAIFVHSSSPADTIQIWDTKWLTAGTPVKAFSMPHGGSGSPVGHGHSIEAVVTGTGSSIIAHVYRIGNANSITEEAYLITDNIDISCIAADTTSPPLANALYTNVSAGLRADKNNYYGDKFTLTDASSSGVAISNTYWDTNTDGTANSVDITTNAPTLGITGYLPCDTSIVSASVFSTTGVGCGASVGLPATDAPAQSFRFGEQSRNQNGLSTNPAIPPPNPSPLTWFTSAPIPFAMPQIGIAGYTPGSSKGNGTLRVLSGGTIDASSTQGNITDPGTTFLWAFVGGNTPTASGITTPVPTGATSFSLIVTWPGGYFETVGGAIIQTDIVPSFTMSPNPVGLGASVTLTNTLQKSSTTTLNSVQQSVVLGSCPGTPSFTGTLAASFDSLNGTDHITAPSALGTYCVTLQYNYTPSGSSQTSQIVSNPLNVINAQLIASVSGPSTGTVGTPVTFTANVSGGAQPYQYAWNCNYSQFQTGTFTAGSATQSCTFNTNGGYTPAVRITDANSTITTVFGNISISGGSSGNLTASVSGSSTGSIGTPTGTRGRATTPFSAAAASSFREARRRAALMPRTGPVSSRSR